MISSEPLPVEDIDEENDGWESGVFGITEDQVVCRVFCEDDVWLKYPLFSTINEKYYLM